MRQLCIALAVVAGCGFEHGRFNSRNDASSIDVASRDAYVDARIIDAQNAVPDAMVDAPPAIVDTDMDTIADAVDNCPAIANTNQRNHDGDTPGDVCDRCPHLANNLDPDGDSDGVGDACDPRPATAGDLFVLFEGFYDATGTTAWATTGVGTWTVANGFATQSATTTGVSTFGPTTVITRTAVTTQLRVIAFGSGTGFSTPAISVVAGVAGTGQAYYCSASLGNGISIYSTADWVGGFNINSTMWPGTFTNNSEIRLTETLQGTTENCTAVQGTFSASVPPTGTGPIGGAAKLSTTTASASFDYLFVVTIGA